MPLPKIKSPLFEMIIPSTKEKVIYRSFLGKEEKILLIARESGDINSAILAIKQVVNNCLIDKDVDELAMFDLVFALMTIRAKSIDNNIAFAIKDPDTDESVRLEVSLDDTELHEYEGHSKEIRVNDEYTLHMRYPTINEFITIMNITQEKDANKRTQAEFDVMCACMDKLIGEDEVFNFKEFSNEEVVNFVDSLDRRVITKLEEFFKTMPTLRHEVKYVNSAGNEKTFVIQGIESFFI